MVKNKTGFTSLDEFDSTLPEDAVQNLRIERSMKKPNTNITFIEYLYNRDIISINSVEKVGVFLELELDNKNDLNEHSLVNYNVPIVTGSYNYDTENNIAFIGSVVVQDELRGRGLGTQMKKHVNNMIEQEKNGIKCYTWLASDGGKKLAKNTGFTPDEGKFSDVDAIWSREF